MIYSYMKEERWVSIKDNLPKTRGKSAINHRDFLEAVCWVAKNCGSWEKLPENFGNWQTVKNRYRRWVSCGYIDDIVDKYIRYEKAQQK